MFLLTALSPIISFCIAALIVCVVVYVLKLVTDYLGVPAPMRNIIFIIITLLALLYLANRFLGFSF